MLVRCPQCGTEFRRVESRSDERVIKYLCSGCEAIVQIDLERDEIPSSSSSGSFRTLERPRTVLVADDDDGIRETAGRLLREAGFSVLEAADGVDALQVMRDEHPDLVVLDLLMPRMTGFDVLREMRQDSRIADIPVVAMSGVYKGNVTGFLESLGARDFVEKERLGVALVVRTREILGSGAES